MTTGTTTAPTTPRAGTPAAAHRARRNRLPLILIIPTLVLLVAALGYPIGWQVVTSFRQFGLMQQFGAPAPFVGLDNYIALVTDPYLWTVVVRSDRLLHRDRRGHRRHRRRDGRADERPRHLAPRSRCRSPCSSRGRCPSSPR